MNDTRSRMTAHATESVLDTFLALVRIDSPSGEEAMVATELLQRLKAVGCEAWTDTHGNVVGRRAGLGKGVQCAPLLLSSHMDTVQPGYGVQPVVVDGVVRSDGTTILGADDKAGLTAILTALSRSAAAGRSRPIEIAFTVQEEVGLVGAKLLDQSIFVARDAIVIDSAGPVGAIVARGPAQDSLTFEVTGVASHAGVAPEAGISAITVAARAIAAMHQGRIDPHTTANIGVISGGVATNIVAPSVTVRGEARSLDPEALAAQTSHMRACFEEAAMAAGATATVQITRSYEAIHLDETAPAVALVCRAMRSVGVEPEMIATGGGSDANVMAGRGITAINLGFGVVGPHALTEHIAVADLEKIAEVATAILIDTAP